MTRPASFWHPSSFRLLVCAAVFAALGSAREAAAQPRPPRPRDSSATTATVATTPSASTPAAEHFHEALALFNRDEIVSACRMFEQSYAEDAAPGTLYNLALCHEREGRIADAYREYDQLASRAEATGRTDKAVGIRARANALLPKLARVDLIHRADAVAGVTGLSIDKVVFLADIAQKPVYVAPGTHEIVIQHGDGVVVTRRTAKLVAGESQRIEMEDPAPKRTGPLVLREGVRVNKSKRIGSYVSGGAGVALVVAAAVLGIEALHKKNDLQDKCGTDNLCDSSAAAMAATDERSTGKTFATLSTVGFAAGGAALAAAVYLFVSSRETATEKVSAWRFEPATDGHGAGLQLGYRF